MNGDPTKTQGEIESAIAEGISRFEVEYMGRGPQGRAGAPDAGSCRRPAQRRFNRRRATSGENIPPDKGRDLLKQVRSQLLEIARPTMEQTVEAITGSRVVSFHHDISTVTGEEVVLFTLDEPPVFRQPKKKF